MMDINTTLPVRTLYRIFVSKTSEQLVNYLIFGDQWSPLRIILLQFVRSGALGAPYGRHRRPLRLY